MSTLTERLDKAEEVNRRLSDLRKGRYSDGRRLVLPLAYLNLCLDHHQALILLMRNGLYGSALAIVRLMFEAMIRAHWVAKCASNSQVDKIAENDNFPFPNMTDLTKAVDQAFSDPKEKLLTFFQQAKEDAWEATNSYTHSGLLQLARQFSGDRIEARYADEDLLSAASASTASVLMLGYLIARITSREKEAAAIEGMFG